MSEGVEPKDLEKRKRLGIGFFLTGFSVKAERFQQKTLKA